MIRPFSICSPHALGLWLLLTAAAVGCSGSQQSASAVYRADLGRAPSAPLLADIVASTLQGYGFQIRTISSDLIVTEWRRQSPTLTEFEAGVTRIRDQARVRITERGTDEAVARLRITYEASEGERWAAAEPSQTVVRQYEQIQRDIRDRLQQFMTQ